MKSLFLVASLLTYPISKARETYWMGRAQGSVVYIKVILFLVIGMIGAPFGVLIRFITSKIMRKPYLYMKGDGQEKMFENTFTLLSWNICFVSAGYAITDGGVFPWRERIQGVVQRIQEADADILCLMEVFDFQASLELLERLKNSYAHFYFNIGPKGAGVSSGFFVASKYVLRDLTFVRFPKEHLVGRTKHAAKGIFAFTFGTETRIFLTHLQQSEECMFPTSEEIMARKHQMSLMMKKLQDRKEKTLVVTGDLNLDEKEFANSPWADTFDRGTFPEEKTWGGDEFCAQLVGKKVSGPLTYDYTMITKNNSSKIATTYVETGYDPKVFKKEAQSDHLGLVSVIKAG